MKFTQLSAALLATITCTTAFAPAYAGTRDHETHTSKTEIQIRSTKTPLDDNASVVIMKQKVQQAQRIIPASTAIAIAFPNALELDAEQETVQTLMTAQPIYDSEDNEIVPARSLVTAHLKPVKGGVEMRLDSMVIRGKTVSIDASSLVIPGQSVTVESATDRAKVGGQIGSKMLGQAFGAINPDNMAGVQRGALAGGVLGMLFGGGTKAKKATIVRIPQGSLYILSVQSPVVLP
jgi:hypothetical protein